MNYLRPLIDYQLTYGFVKGVLGIQKKTDIREAVLKITKAEMQLAHIENKTTLKSDSYRDVFYTEEIDRDELREQILNDLIVNQRIDNDDEISLGKGGALPKTKLISDKQAIIITGLPASGKSTIASKIADCYGAVILDSDFAKRKFPEFINDFGATLVHEESSTLIFGDKNHNINYSLKEYCISQEFNVVIPKIGNDKESIFNLAEYFKNYGYKIHLVLVSLDRVDSTRRAFKRFLDTNRYVPLSLIFDMYSNEPILTYYRIKNNTLFDSYGKISTEGESPVLIEASNISPLKRITL
jgi:hypothetical protein